MKKILLLSILIGSLNAKEKPKEEKIEQIKIGNFALPTSQQPGPLIGFGQNIVDKGDFQAFVYPDDLKGHKKNFSEMIPSILYGITDKSSIFVVFPAALSFRLNNQKSRGPEDFFAQLEYVVWSKETKITVDQITLVHNITFPTGSPYKIPPTGFGAPSFFLGFTASHTATDWYYFGSAGSILTTSHRSTKFGKQVLYQLGLSKNIWYESNKYTFNWIIELDGLYKQRNKILGVIDKNSGGNQIFLGPSLWFSTKKLIVQGGISWVIYQHLFGKQNKDIVYVAFNFGWKFND